MFVADTRMAIKEIKDYEISDKMIDRLDYMLSNNNIDHFFTLPNDCEEPGIAKDGHILDLFYDSKDEMILKLTYMMWAKTEVKVSDEIIMKAMGRIAYKIYN